MHLQALKVHYQSSIDRDFNIFKGEFTRRFQPEVGEFCYDNLPVDTLGDDAITATKIAIDNNGYVYVK